MSIFERFIQFFKGKGENAGANPKKPLGTELEESEDEKIDVSGLSARDSLKVLSRTLRNSDFDAVMIGAFAMGAHNYARLTEDMDLLVVEEKLGEIEKTLGRIGYQKVLKTPQHAKFINKDNINFLHVDVVFVEEKSLKRIVEKAELKIVGEAEFVIASLETVIATKLHAIQHNHERRGYKDIGDVMELAEMNNIDLDDQWFIDLCGKYGGEGTYEKFFAKID